MLTVCISTILYVSRQNKMRPHSTLRPPRLLPPIPKTIPRQRGGKWVVGKRLYQRIQTICIYTPRRTFNIYIYSRLLGMCFCVCVDVENNQIYVSFYYAKRTQTQMPHFHQVPPPHRASSMTRSILYTYEWTKK